MWNVCEPLTIIRREVWATLVRRTTGCKVRAVTHPTENDTLLAIPLLSVLPRDERRALAGRLTHRAVEPGTEVIREGEPGSEMFVVLSGQLRIVSGSGPRPTLLSRIGP